MENNKPITMRNVYEALLLARQEAQAQPGSSSHSEPPELTKPKDQGRGSTLTNIKALNTVNNTPTNIDNPCVTPSDYIGTIGITKSIISNKPITMRDVYEALLLARQEAQAQPGSSSHSEPPELTEPKDQGRDSTLTKLKANNLTVNNTPINIDSPCVTPSDYIGTIGITKSIISNKPITMRDVYEALLLARQEAQAQPGSSSHSEPPELTKPKDQGRGSTLTKLKANNLTVNNTPINIDSPCVTPSDYIGTIGITKSIISNIISLKPIVVFEYNINFEPNLEDANARESFLKRHFKNITQVYFCNESFIYAPRKLQSSELRYTLFNQTLNTTFTMTLRFQQELNLGSSQLFKFIEYLNDINLSPVCSKPHLEVMRACNHSIRQCKCGQMMCIDYRYYAVHTNNLTDEMLDLKRKFPDKYHQAFELFLKKVYIYNKLDNKIYKLCAILWEISSLKLRNLHNQHYVDVTFNNCHKAEIVHNIKSYAAESPEELMNDIKDFIMSEQACAWNLQLNTFTTCNARVLPLETITFGDNVRCTPIDGSWQKNMLENKVVTSIELWCWVILHMPEDESLARLLSNKMQELRGGTGVNIGKALFFPIRSDSMEGYADALNAIINDKIQLIVVLTPNSINQPEMLIKHICCVQRPVPCRIIPASDVRNPLKVHENVLLINAMLGGSLWTVSLPFKNWMISGINIHTSFDNQTLPVCSFVTTFSDDSTQWCSQAVFLEQEFNYYLKLWLIDTLKKYCRTNGTLPTHVLIYHTCTEETKKEIYKHYQNFQFSECMQELPDHNFKICIILVQKDTNTCYFKNLKTYHSVPSGTIVDDVITNSNSRDFFLVSCQASDKEIARPIHYKVIKDTSTLTPDEIQTLTYKLCHLYYKHPWIAKMPAPCIYAEKLGRLITDTIRYIPSPALDGYLYYL